MCAESSEGDDDGCYSDKWRKDVAEEPKNRDMIITRITHNTDNYVVPRQPTCLWAVQKLDPRHTLEPGNFLQ